MALFFLASDRRRTSSQDAPGGAAYLTKDQAHARPAARRSSPNAAPAAIRASCRRPAPGVDPATAAPGPDYLDCWNRYWAWTKTAEFRAEDAADRRLAPDFLDGNFLSTELRVPVTLLETNACSPLATNAIAGNIWDNFSSQTYKDLPSVGTIMVHDPFTGEPQHLQMPAGGRGYTRPASLISLWSTAPFLLNNSVGKFNWQRVGRGAHGLVPGSASSRCCGPRSGRRTRMLGDKIRPGPRLDRPHDRAQLSPCAARLSPRLPAEPAAGGPSAKRLIPAISTTAGSASVRFRRARRSISCPT